MSDMRGSDDSDNEDTQATTTNSKAKAKPESLSENSSLPDLSFDDYLLDETPVKKLSTNVNNSEYNVYEELTKRTKDETLNTPDPKRTMQQREQEHVEYVKSNESAPSGDVSETQSASVDINAGESSNDQKSITPKTVQTVIGAPFSSPTSTLKSNANALSGLPVLLNSKIALSKPTTAPQTIVKIATAPKAMSTQTTALSSASFTTTAKTASFGTVTTIDGKTALKTANGQIVYLQKGQPQLTKTVANVTTIGGSAIAANAIVSSGNSKNAPTAFRIRTATNVPIKAATSSLSSSTATANLPSIRVLPIVSGSSSSGTNTKIFTTTKTATTAAGVATANIGGNKTVIQVIRSADGKLLPLKTTQTAGGKGTLTISPTVAAQLTGKKIISASCGQIVLKAATSAVSLNQNVSGTNTISTVTEPNVTTAKPIKIQKIVGTTTPSTVSSEPSAAIIMPTTVSNVASSATLSTSSNANTTVTSTTQSPTAGGKLVVQGTQIVVPSSQIIKLSPNNSTSGSTSNTTSSGTPISGALHAIQIPGKQGLQYVRVFTAPKKSTSIQSGAIATESTETATAATPSKVLNSIPPKFTVVRPNPSNSKIILTKSPKSDGNQVLSPIAGKMKTIVTVPTLRSISNASDSPTSSSSPPVTTSGSLFKSTTKSSDSTSPITATNSNNITQLRPKPKISEINSEIQRMTTSIGEVKKVVSGPDGKRYLVMPRSMLRTAQTAGSTNRLVCGEQQPQTQQSQNQTNQEQLQQQHHEQRSTQQPKVYSVVKNNSTSAILAASASEGAMKSFIICKSAQSGVPLKGIQVKRSTQQITQTRFSVQPKDEENQKKVPSVTSPATQSSNNKFVPIKIKQEPLDGDDLASLMFSDEALVRGGVRRKHCNCSKSQCLKLYCDCFANGEFCQDCTCKDCFNNLQYEDERQRAIKSCLERNPSAFKPKITTSSDQGDTRLHNKGCNCKRSGCLKNYCECFEAKIPCSSNCKCVGCRNVEDRPDLDMDPIDPKLLESIANASNATNTIARAVSTSNQATFVAGLRRTYDKAFTKNEFKNESDNFDENDQRFARKKAHLDDDITGAAALLASPQLGDNAADDGNAIGEKRNANFITQEVIDATIQCMISQADECLKNSLPANQIEKMVLEELGRCLVEIIDFSIRNTDTSFSQN